MFKNYELTLDIATGDARHPLIQVNTNDLDSFKISFIITQHKEPVDLTGKTIRIAILKPDRKTVLQDCTLTDAENGKGEVILDTQAYALGGKHYAEVMVYDGLEKVAVTGRFVYNANRGILNDGTVESTNEWQSINQAIADAENILIDLRENGTGVDAQARQDLESVTAQLAQTSENITHLDNNKIDQVVFDVSTSSIKFYANQILIHEVSVSEAGNASAVQSYIDTLVANGQIEGVSLADGMVTPKKTSFVKFKGTGKNLYNPNAEGILENSLLNATDGSISSNTAYEVTDFMPVKEGDTVVVSRASGTRTLPRTIGYYNSNKSFVSGVDLPSYKFVVPAGVSYLRVTHGNDDVDFQVEISLNVTKYEPYQEFFELDQEMIQFDIPDNDITTVKSITKNLYNPNAEDISPMSIINDDGTISSNSTYEITGFMDVNQGDRVSVSRNNELTENTSNIIRSHGWYDINKNWIGGSGNIAQQPLVAPNRAKFLRITHNPEDQEYQVEIGSSPTPYEPYVGKETIDTNKVAIPPIPSYLTTIYGGKLVANGDSITAEESPYGVDIYGFPTRIADAYHMTLYNYAIGGSTVAVKEATPTERTPLVTRYQEMTDNADLVLIAIGTNDWQYDWTPVGTMADRTNFTFYGALHNLCLGLMEKYLGKPIVFATPIKRSATPYTGADAVNGNGKTLGEYGEIIKEVCGYYGIPVLDMFNECTLNPTIQSQLDAYMPDGTHPNSAGHEIMARRWVGYLKQLL